LFLALKQTGLYYVNMGDAKKSAGGMPAAPDEVRERILRTAAELFYSHGAHAVGVDLVVERAGVAKTSLYRHFRSKDELIAAFLQAEDEAFWTQWDAIAREHRAGAESQLDAHILSVAERMARPNYRGCPQLNMAAEFSDAAHPARLVAISHKQQLRRRLTDIAERLPVARPRELAAQLLLLLNGAFVSSEVIAAEEAAPVLLAASHALIAAARRPV
jgi:AcrR family transcriptional regulator